MWPGDIEGAGDDLMINAVYERPPAALRNIVDLIAAVSVGMAGNGALKPFIDKIQRMKAGVRYGKMNICVLVVCPHDGASFLIFTV